MTIGIGITTYNRPEHLKLCQQMIDFNTDYGFRFYVHDDKEQKGIAYGKNMCLNKLKDCDHIFLFDDDCFPIKEGWIDYFINSGYNHSCYMTGKYQPLHYADKHTTYLGASGVFMYITKKTLETVGYFNPEYGRYGFEHAGYSHRVFQAGLIPSRFICLNDTKDYIHSLDLDGIEGYEYLDHKCTLNDDEKRESIRLNDKIYHKETTEHQIYYDFKP